MAGTQATRSLPLSQELLNYYRARIEEFESERALTIQKVDECDVSLEEHHRLQWELRKKMDEVEDLQRALNDAHVYLYDERQQLLQVYSENDALKIQELEDRQRIRQLLSLTQPVTQEITYFPNKKPMTLRRAPPPGDADEPPRQEAAPLGSSVWAAGAAAKKPLPKSRRRPAASTSATAAAAAGVGAGAGTGAGAGAGTEAGAGGAPVAKGSTGVKVKVGGPGGQGAGSSARVLRTVYMPNEQNDTLLLTVESLRAQLAEQTRLHQEQLAAVKEDRRRRVEEERVRSLHDKEKIDDLIQQNQKLQRMLTRNTKEYLTFRHNAQITQRLMKEDLEQLEQDNRKLSSKCQDLLRRTAAESKVAQQSAVQAAEEVAAEFRKQCMAKDDRISRLEASLDLAQSQYAKRAQSLQDRNKRLAARIERAEAQAKLEREGFRTQVQDLQAQVAKLQDTLHAQDAESGDPRAASDAELMYLNAALATASRSKKHIGMLNRLRARVAAAEAQVGSTL